MPFGGYFDRYFQNIFAPAAVAADLRPVRADSVFTSTQIIDDIWRLTREAAILIADLSDKNPNVFYELGLAHAIGKPVVIVSHDLEDIPFDLRGLRVLIYDKNDEGWGAQLQKRIIQALRESLRDVPSAIPTSFVNANPDTRPSEDPVTHEVRKLRQEVRALRSQRPFGSTNTDGGDTETRYKEIVTSVRERIAPEKLSWATDAILAHVISEIASKRLMNAINLIYETSGESLRSAKAITDEIRAVLGS